MADCVGCPYLRQEGEQALCAMRNNEVLNDAAYSKETCEHYQAFLNSAPPAAEEVPDPGKKDKKKKGGGVVTGCLVALLVTSIILFLGVVGLIAATLYLGGSITL